MDAIFDKHWDNIVQLIIMLAMFINGHTPNWKVWPGRIGKILGLLTKVLGLWTADKGIKWKEGDPDRRSKPDPISLAGIVVLLAISCAHQPGPSETMAIQHESCIDKMNVVCMARARKCIASGAKEPSECPSMQECQMIRDDVASLMKKEITEVPGE
jgi:hypothetical protein